MSEIETMRFIAPNGAVRYFSQAQGMDPLWGISGRFMPPFEIVEDDLPGLDGSYVSGVNVRPRDVVIPFFMDEGTPSGLRAFLRQLSNELAPTEGDGLLEAIHFDGSIRQLICRYADGLQLNEKQEDGRGQSADIVFRASDPYWYAQGFTTQDFSSENPEEAFLKDPFLPLTLASSSVFGETWIENDGVATWPIWVIQGPAEGALFHHNSTGEEMSLTFDIDLGESITIDTRPFMATIEREDGSNVYDTLDLGGVMFPLYRGTNHMNVELSGSTADSLIQLQYRSRYWTP